MARLPNIADIQERLRAAANNVREAVNSAKGRTGGEGRLVAFSAGGLLLAFLLLAVLAPLLMKAPAITSSIVGGILFLLIVVATAIGALALWRMIKAGRTEATQARQQAGAIYSLSAVEAALSDAEDAGLRAVVPREAHEAMTGKLNGCPVAVVKADTVTYAVVRLKVEASASLLLAPGQSAWPFAFPNDGPLSPIQAPNGVSALVWSNRREGGIATLASLAPALQMASMGGEVPYLSVRGRALVLMWRKADVATACVIAGEAAKAMG
jgi:hypothetical protein